MSAIAVSNLCFSYDDEVVLQDISMRIPSGEFVCLLGESGCGKSTFLRLMAGLAKPDAGDIRIDDRLVEEAGLDRGVVFQDYSLFPWLTVGRNILIALRQKFHDAPDKELKERILQGLVDVGLDEGVYNKYPFELSGGMKQRCAICRAFALDPPVLLMDEPFGALDAITRGRLQRMTHQLWKKDEDKRKTIVFVTHDVDEALLLSGAIVLLGSTPGRVIYSHSFAKDGKPPFDEVLEDPDIIALRNKLLHILNKDIANKL